MSCASSLSAIVVFAVGLIVAGHIGVWGGAALAVASRGRTPRIHGPGGTTAIAVLFVVVAFAAAMSLIRAVVECPVPTVTRVVLLVTVFPGSALIAARPAFRWADPHLAKTRSSTDIEPTMFRSVVSRAPSAQPMLVEQWVMREATVEAVAQLRALGSQYPHADVAEVMRQINPSRVAERAEVIGAIATVTEVVAQIVQLAKRHRIGASR